MDKEQILALAEEQGAVANLKQHFNMAGDSIVFTPEELEAFFNAAIKSYKAELLKEVVEPVAEVIWFDPALELFPSKQPHKIIDGSMSFMDSSKIGTKFYTSDQLAAAILKATKPLEDQLAALKAENESMRKDAERLDWVEHQDFHDLSFAILVDQPNDGMTAVSISEGWHLGNNLREAIDAAMVQDGENSDAR